MLLRTVLHEGEFILKAIAIQSLVRFERKTVKTKEPYRDTAIEDEPFCAEAGEATMRNGLNWKFSMVGFEMNSDYSKNRPI